MNIQNSKQPGETSAQAESYIEKPNDDKTDDNADNGASDNPSSGDDPANDFEKNILKYHNQYRFKV